MTATHVHHKIPRHAGGTDDPSNLVRLTIPEHAEAHRLLYEQFGRLQDKIAWKALSGKTDEMEQARIELFLQNRAETFSDPVRVRQLVEKRKATIAAKVDYVSPLLGLNIESASGHHLDRLLESSERAKKHQEEGRISNIGDHVRGRPVSYEQRKRQSEKASSRPKMTCEHCRKDVVKQMYVRWHGPKCPKRVSD